MRKVIDVSDYNGHIDWKKVKESGIEGAILKIIRKDLNPDKQFESNWAGCRSAGIAVEGVYNYSYAVTESKAIYDAKRVLSILAGRKAKVWLDVEDPIQKGIGKGLIDMIRAYQKVIEKAGLEFGVYTGLSFYNSYIKPYAPSVMCGFWIARYPSGKKMTASSKPPADKKPVIKHKLEGWQYSNAGQIPGIRGNVDMNIWYGDRTSAVPAGTVYGGLDYSPVFDAEYYLDRYKDLKAAYGNNVPALFHHFIVHGMNEGRQAADLFNVLAYKARYSDLQKAFGENLPLYYQHYIRFGINEGRNAL